VSSIIYQQEKILYFNTFVGFCAFSFKIESIFSFESSIIEPSTLKFDVGIGFQYFTFSYLIFETYYCNYQTPYFYHGGCYDVCPDGTYSDTVLLECKSCPYDCLTCNSISECLSCSAEIHFRQLNNNTKRCQPIYGYYDDGFNIIAQSCIDPCKSCSSKAHCLECKNNSYFINFTDSKC